MTCEIIRRRGVYMVRWKHLVMEKFANNVRQLRIEKGWTQAELARKAKISMSSLSNYENEKQMPGIYKVYRIAEALEVSENDLLGITNKDMSDGGDC